MSARSFKRKVTRGVLDSRATLIRLFTHGPHDAKYPNHIIINRLVEKGLVCREGNIIELTQRGVDYVSKEHPRLTQFTEGE